MYSKNEWGYLQDVFNFEGETSQQDANGIIKVDELNLYSLNRSLWLHLLWVMCAHCCIWLDEASLIYDTLMAWEKESHHHFINAARVGANAILSFIYTY